MADRLDHQLSGNSIGTRESPEELQQELIREIERLNRFSVRGILALSLFLVISLYAWSGFSVLPAPDTFIAEVGKPPSTRIISVVLLLYTFSAIILSLSRMAAGVEHPSSFSHVGFLTVFFLMYYFGKALEDNYWAVFGSGITILGIESYRIWTFCTEGISRNRGNLEYMRRTGRPPPNE